MKPETFDLRALLDLPEERFLPEAFRTLLGRDPDDGGLLHYAQQLQTGLPRSLVLAELRASAEGRAQAALRPCESLDQLVKRYLAVRGLPLGRWRWRLLPHFDVRNTRTNRFNWIDWANAYVAGRYASVAPAQSNPVLQGTAQVEQINHKFDVLLAELQQAVTALKFFNQEIHCIIQNIASSLPSNDYAKNFYWLDLEAMAEVKNILRDRNRAQDHLKQD